MIRVGPAGWSYADWEGRAWPRSKPRGFHPLAHLARFVDCIEINSSFYALTDPAHCARWVDLVADRPDFTNPHRNTETKIPGWSYQQIAPFDRPQ